MTSTVAERLWSLVERIGGLPGDSAEQRSQRALLVSVALFPGVAGVVWGSIFALYDEPLVAVIPYGYTALSVVNVVAFALTRRYGIFRFVQLLLILLLPFGLLVALGGYVTSGAVIVWSFLCPTGALLFDEPRRAPRWFLAYLALVLISGLLQPWLGTSSRLPPGVVLAFFILNIGVLSLIAFGLLRYFIRRQRETLDLLRVEQEKSENLLLNILPREIAAILKNGNRTIADHYDGASILFADLVGFTPLSAELEPVEMVELLNEVFSTFDSLVEKYDLEKIRTIGDNYLAVSGVPRPRRDHAHAMARMALEMCAYVGTLPPARNGRRLDFRIGINSGPVVAGVIGRKKFVYDVWGDAVNLASRMESQGLAGKIQIGRGTYELIQDEFVCEPRGVVSVKGKGEMETWILVGPMPGR